MQGDDDATSTTSATGRVRQPVDYDALLIVSFGGPEAPEDVSPFLDNVFRGLPVTPQTKEHVAQRYERFGGVSPINNATRAFIKALQHELDAHGPALPIYWGNRNWHPFLADTIAKMTSDGVRRALVYVTSVFGSYSGCRKYREDLYEAAAGIGGAPAFDKLRLGYNHPGFIEATCDRVRAALEQIGGNEATPILFSAHSLPQSMARCSRYEAQLEECCRLVGDALEHQRWHLVYQSNNASYGREPWLGPDVAEALRSLAADGVRKAVIAPIGFVADHLEIVLDLDVEAAGVASDVGVEIARATTVGTHPAYIAMVRELVCERVAPDTPRRALGTFGPSHDACPTDCCLSGRPGPPRPALCGADASASAASAS
jgi:ferrochelatase